MKIVIDIDEETYTRIKTAMIINAGNTFYNEILTSVAEGTPLPKGHGRLVDENYIIAELVYRKHLLSDGVKCGEVTKIFDNAVVIDADKRGKTDDV